MVYLTDVGSTFDAPIDYLWKYLDDGDLHDAAHTTSRHPKFEKVSEITFTYACERYLQGKWAPDKVRMTMFPPLGAALEFLEGVLAGSKLVYVYSPQGEKTGIDVYGDFHSDSLPPADVERVAREFLDSEYRADAPAVRAAYRKHKDAASGTR